jgi:glucan endo-1,3-alpha-glucosidase
VRNIGMSLKGGLSTALLLTIVFGLQSSPAQAQSRRMVFAHYMVTNQDYQDNSTGEAKVRAYMKEIQQAQAIGIDGFALNVGSWLSSGTGAEYYIAYSSQMFEAAARLNSGFKLMFSADFCCGNKASDAEDMMRRFVNYPRFASVYFRHNGKYVLTTFAGDALGMATWQKIKSELATGANPSTGTVGSVFAPTTIAVAGAPSNAPIQIFLVPAFFGAFGGELPAQSQIQSGFNTWSSIVDGLFYWGIAGVPGGSAGGYPDQIPSSEAYASVLHSAGKLYMAPIALQFWGSDAARYFEYSGYQGMRDMWMNAINVTHPEWVEIITWNDFIEGTYVSPIDDPNKYQFADFLVQSGLPTQPGPLGYFHSHVGAWALLPYFIEWYKTGFQPNIAKNSVFWAYRTQSVNDKAASGIPALGTLNGPIADEIYVTANVAQPGTLTVTSGTLQNSFTLPAGSTDVQAPFIDGNPPIFNFTPTDQNCAALIGSGTDPIGIYTYSPASGPSIQYNDEYYSTGFLTAPRCGASGNP